MRDRSSVISEATRLTRDGRLTEALELLRGALSGDAASAPGAPGGTPGQHGGVLEKVRSHFPDSLRTMLDHLTSGEDDARSGHAQSSDAALAPGARFLKGEHGNAAGTRGYRLFVPGSPTGEARPLLVLLHGCTQSPEDIATGSEMNRLGEIEGCLALYPAQSQAANHSKCWNWFSGNDQRRDAGEVSIIADMIRAIARDFPIDRSRIFVAGMSAGGAAAANLAVAYPELFAGLGIHSGLPAGAAHDLPSALQAMRDGCHEAAGQHGIAIPTIVFHGDQDSTVHPDNGGAIVAQARRGVGTALQPTAAVQHGFAGGGLRFTRSRHADRTGRPVIEHWLVEGLGHAWSGGNPRGSYTDTRGPSASEAMLRFFLDRGH